MTPEPTPLHAQPKPEPSASESELELMAMMRFAKDQYALAALRAHVAEQTAQSRAALAKWETELSAVMPSDFKDWWQNAKEEWPVVARLVIESLRERESSAMAALAQCEERLAATEARFQEVSDAEVRTFQKGLVLAGNARDAEAKLAQCEEKLAKAEADRDAWKASHDNQVNLRRMLMDRPDLGDRAKSIQALTAAHAKALEDGKRLDWLQATRLRGWANHGTDHHAMYEIDLDVFAGETLRAAIDDEMSKESAPSVSEKQGTQS